MNANDLDRELAELRQATAAEVPPPATDRAIAEAIAKARGHGHHAARRHDRWLAWPLALAASIAVLSFVVRMLPPEAIVAEPAALAASAAGDFLPIASLADIESAGDTWVVPARLPRTTLAQLGWPVNPALAGDAIDTELLVRRDGSVLAVRFVY